MPHEMIWEQKGVYQRLTGQLTEEDREHATHAVMGDPRFDAMKTSCHSRRARTACDTA